MADRYDTLDTLIEELTKTLGRIPSEDEVHDFIYGDEVTRLNILNSAVDKGE